MFKEGSGEHWGPYDEYDDLTIPISDHGPYQGVTVSENCWLWRDVHTRCRFLVLWERPPTRLEVALVETLLPHGARRVSFDKAPGGTHAAYLAAAEAAA